MNRKLLLMIALLGLVISNAYANATFYAKVKTVVGTGKGTVYVRAGENQDMTGITATNASGSKEVGRSSTETHVPFTIKATPSIGYEFSNISDGNESYTNSQITYQALTRSTDSKSPDETTVTAYFTAKKYIVTFNANGGTIPDNGNMGNTPDGKETSLSEDKTSGRVKVTYDTRDFHTMGGDIPVKEGYRFTGWFDGDIMVYDANGVGTGDYWKGDDDGWSHDDDVTLTANWEQLAQVNMTVSKDKYGTFCAPFDFPKHGVIAYTVSSVSKSVLQLDEVGGNNIPANTPVVIYNSTGEDVNVDEWGAPATRDTCEEGLLVGLLKAVDVPANSYILKTLEGGQKFYKLTTTSTGKANRCYLKEGNYSSAKLLSFDDEEATDISAIDALNYGADIYNANGVKINSLQKGMNIVKMTNGSIKKIFVK